MTTQANALQRIGEIVGSANVFTDDNDLEPYVTEWRGLWRGNCQMVVKPGAVNEVSEVVRICNAHGVPVVPLGGNTGLVGGGVPDGGIVLSTERLTQVRDVDPVNFTITCEAGCVLSDIQNAADDAERLFPLSLAAEGSCRIGGNLSTNAGGVQVLRYGNARDLMLGLEVVLPDGEIWDGLRGLRKDNTGYDLKHLFAGAEGTLGVITACVLKLFPRAAQKETALVALPSPKAAIDLFSRISTTGGEALSAFEIMNGLSLDLSVSNIPGNRFPLENTSPWYVLLELTSSHPGNSLRTALENVLESCFEDRVVTDGVVAESSNQSDDIWKLRESIPEAQGPLGGSIKNDITVPISSVVRFIELADAAVQDVVPGARPVTFGHIGDGNLHYNISQPADMEKAAYLDRWRDVTDVINPIVDQLGGSFSAEHGIGQLKRKELTVYRSGVEVAMMKAIKKTLDPKNIMNPGKLFLD